MAALNAAALWGFICIPPIRAGFFPARRLSKSAAKPYIFLRDEVSAVQAKHQPLGLFFFALF